MQLQFEHEVKIADGLQGIVLQFPDQEVQAFYIVDGLLKGDDDKLNNTYDWSSLSFPNSERLAPDNDISFPSLRMMSREGIYGVWKSGTKHRLAIYLFEYKIDNYVEDGEISMDIDTPISSSSITINNPSYLFANEKAGSLLAPGSKIIYSFQSGDSEVFDIGQHYCDSSKFNILSGILTSSSRNTIGKTLKDQSFDENNIFAVQNFKTLLETILVSAGLSEYSGFNVEDTELALGMDFDPNTSLFEGIYELLKNTNDWKISELADGTIVIGSEGYSGHYQPSEYVFYRDEDIFSREISRDDAESYTRVCVYTPQFMDKVFADVVNYSSWRIGAKKTLYIGMAEGTSHVDLEAYANRMAVSLGRAGQIESFSGPFRPHLLPGDTARIIDSKNEISDLGVITSIGHKFGKDGFYTNLTVDSGGVVVKGRISDYIKKLQRNNALKYRKYE